MSHRAALVICGAISHIGAGECPLPEFTPGGGLPQDFRIPACVDVGGRLPDLIVQADSRLWFYINESKRNKILFSEPIVLTTTDNQLYETAGVAQLTRNRLTVRLPDGSLVWADVVGEDVPQLLLIGEVETTEAETFYCPEPLYVLRDVDGDGIADLVTEKGWYKGSGSVSAPVFDKILRDGASPPDFRVEADFNGDGIVDCVLGGNGRQALRSRMGK